VLSDTHGLLREEVLVVLEGVDRIIHAGDVGTPDLLRRLRKLAPVTAVRGNTDSGHGSRTLPESEVVEIGGVLAYVLHDLERLDLDPAASGFQVVISGHSHRPSLKTVQGVLFLNPGSAGPRRFRLPVSLALLDVVGMGIQTRFVTLEP
jgi:putative phosphoesterase